MITILVILASAIIVTIILNLLRKTKKGGLEVKEKILEFYKLLPELEKGNPKTKKRALKILNSLKKLFMDFSIEVKERTGNKIFGRQEIDNLKELMNKYQNANIDNKIIIHSIKNSVKKIEILFSQGMLAMYKKINENKRNS